MLGLTAWVALSLQAGPSCADVRAKLAKWFAAAGEPIALVASPPDPLTNDDAFCPDFQRARLGLGPDGGEALELGLLGDRHAAVYLHGPGGSGRYWTVAVAVESARGVVGACVATETLAWRNIHDFEDQFVWRALVPAGRGGPRLMIWASLLFDAELPSLNQSLVARAFRLDGARLVFDADATRAQLDRLAATYRAIAARPDDRSAALHRAVADGYTAFTTGHSCPK